MKVFLTILLMTLSLFAFANAGSPFVWFSTFHLLIANAVIGIIESAILTKYGISNKMWLVILGNYISMAIGFFVILPLIATTNYGRDIESSSNYFVGLLTAFAATLLIEYPFFVRSLKLKSDKEKLLKPFLVANISTNACMLFIYLLFSN